MSPIWVHLEPTEGSWWGECVPSPDVEPILPGDFPHSFCLSLPKPNEMGGITHI